jgi:hypothetical protein
VTDFAAVIDTLQLPVPLQAPPQPEKVEAADGVAVIVTLAFAACCALQPEPPLELHCRPAPEMVPLPVPATWAESRYVTSVPWNSALTTFALLIVSVHVVVVEALQSPPQSVKSLLDPDAGTAVSVSVVFCASDAVQPEPPAAVQ